MMHSPCDQCWEILPYCLARSIVAGGRKRNTFKGTEVQQLAATRDW